MRAASVASAFTVLAFIGFSATAAAALPPAPPVVEVDPPPVHVGPVAIDPNVAIIPSDGVQVGIGTQIPGSSNPTVGVGLGPDGAHASGPGGIGAVVSPPPAPHVPGLPAVAPALLPNPASSTRPPAVGASAPADPTRAGTPAPVINTPAPAHTFAPAATSPDATVANATPERVALSGSVTRPHETPWSQLVPTAKRLAPWIALLALAWLLRAVVSGWARDVRRRRALSPS